MNSRDLFNAAFAHFERLLRWVFPGLLLWAVIPFALGIPTDGYGKFYADIPASIQAIIVTVTGFVIYLFERLILHEGLLGLVLYRRGIGGAVNFPNPRGYPSANGEFLFRRFGERPNDLTEPIEAWREIEQRFSDYMVGRMSWVHALGSTWLVGIALPVICLLRPASGAQSAVAGWPLPAWIVYGVVIGVLFIGWTWQVVLAARAEQAHYTAP